MIRIILTTIILLCTLTAKAAIQLPSVIGDHMVLKQNSVVALWGTEIPGTKLTIFVSWDSKTYETIVNEKGKWISWINTPSAGGPYTICLSGKNQVTISDVLIGEVWLSSGQSNMELIMSKDSEAETMIKQANNSSIRLFKVGRQKSDTTVDHFAEGTVWKVCDSESVADFSAMSYYFALDLYTHLGVPVGIINASWGGTPIESWIPTITIMSDTLLQNVVERWDIWEKDYSRDYADYSKKLEMFKQGEVKIRPKKPESVRMIENDFRKHGVFHIF